MRYTIIAHPNAKKPRIEEDLLGTLHVYVNAPPLDGKANMAVIDALAKHFSVKKSQVTILSGMKTKQKIIAVST